KYFQQLKEIDAQDDIKRTRLVDDYKKQSAILRERELIAIKKGATGVDELEAIREERAQLDEGRSRALQDLSAQTNHAKELAEITLNTGVYQAKFNEEMQRSVSLAETLKNVFGEVGEKVGTLTVSLTEYGQQQKKNADAMASLKDQQIMAIALDDREKVAALDEEIAKQQTKSSDDELKNSAKVAGSIKNLFKEKTAAHKTFAALEKASHVARLIMSAKEIAVTIGQTVSFITQSFGRQAAAAAEAGVLGVKAVINSMSTLPPPFNFAAGAAMTALVASLLASIGQSFRGGGNRPSISTEDINKTQGSAMEYNQQGQLVQVRPGVLGDTSAKSDSVRKSISMIEKYTLEGMPINDAQLQYLKLIEKNTKAAAISIYGATG
ncbi:MAG: hypothetical protein EB072_21305, partial [Betaproteobacteria bacterium]|nr:hypothetical protein [Betaproteobacteria bacterium]